ALQCFQLARARCVPVPCDDDGLIPKALEALIDEHRPKLLYTVPTFHNPTGRTLPLERRRRLVELADQAALWMVEDDPYGALRYALLNGLSDALPPGSTHNWPEGGMFVWARLPDGWDAAALLPRALEREVAYVPGEHFFSGPPDRASLRLSFTTHDPDEIER